ncbi:MAG: toxic anion resistance protein [Lachnospiraceae bacterium]|nr:toxic anion resistance protein [Lachnospiraceae bacterium]
MEEKIELTLDPFAKKAEEEAAEIVPADAEYMKDVVLTDEEQTAITEFAAKIDITDTNSVMTYGAASQQKVAEFSDTALQGIKTKDLGEVGAMITNLVAELKNEPTESKGFLGLFKKNVPVEKLKAQYATTEKNVEKISDVLEDHQIVLTKDAAMLDEMYSANLTYYKELTMYILAGKKALEDAKEGKLKELQAKAAETGLPEDAQAAADYADIVTRFEKKLYDLELTRTVSMQMAPQIRLIQNNDSLMVERIQSTLVNTIPLWKNQLVLSLGLAHSQEALKAEKEVTDLTNELLKKNADILKTGTIEIAKESERSVVDIETLKETNQKLIESLTEVTRIQEEGRKARANAEGELAQIEEELKTKLLALSTQSNDSKGEE